MEDERLSTCGAAASSSVLVDEVGWAPAVLMLHTFTGTLVPLADTGLGLGLTTVLLLKEEPIFTFMAGFLFIDEGSSHRLV